MTPIIPGLRPPKGYGPQAGTGKRFKTNMISALSNRGDLRFMTFRTKFSGGVFIEFLKRLIRSQRKPIYLIGDNHPVHISAAVLL